MRVTSTHFSHLTPASALRVRSYCPPHSPGRIIGPGASLVDLYCEAKVYRAMLGATDFGGTVRILRYIAHCTVLSSTSSV